MTWLCVPIFVEDVEKARGQIEEAVKTGAQMIELRADAWSDLHSHEALWALAKLARAATVPCIFTCRAAWEGGGCDLPEEQRLELLESSMDSDEFSCVDVELTAALRRPDLVKKGTAKRRVILSSHDFAGRPDKLYSLLVEMADLGSGINKVAWLARTVRDNLEAFEILCNKTRPTIAVCMGEAGIISRILAKKFGAFLTFAALNEDSATAPGQITIDDLKHLYRWDAMKPETRVYGVVAHPVAHSMSPAIHNAAFDATNFDGVYVPFLVEPGYESFKAFMETFLAFTPLDLSGLSVTLPHKENALRYLQFKNAWIEPLAARIGAVNTIVIRPGGELRGLNTDYAAILDSITERLNISREELSVKRVAVIGAGGTGRTAVAALAYYGAGVTVFNRTAERAKKLAEEFDGQTGRVTAADLEDVGKEQFDIYVNTTSVGMHPNADQSPIGATALPLSDQTLVFDAIYNPAETRFLREAQEAGALTVGGAEMFLRQAVAQFEAWTGIAAPAAVMREVIERRLAVR